jgi:hypothetical protein
MGSLDDPKVQDYHDQIQRALTWSSQPDWQKTCEILNGMSMHDMLDELWRIRTSSHLNGLSLFAPRASGVNIARLRAGIGALQLQPPGDFDSLVRMLPDDQQFAIVSVCAVTQAPANLSPALWSKYYWQTRALAAPDPISLSGGSGGAAAKGKGKDDDDAHLAADVATGITANAPKGANPATYTVTLIYRNLDAFKFGSDDTEVDLLHEPNISLQMSPDPNNPLTRSAAFSLINLHLKRNWGLIKPDIEGSVGPQLNLSPNNTLSAALQAQIELHITTQISLTFSSSLSVGPAPRPGDPPDYGSLQHGNLSFSPFNIGLIGHWDPP